MLRNLRTKGWRLAPTILAAVLLLSACDLNVKPTSQPTPEATRTATPTLRATAPSSETNEPFATATPSTDTPLAVLTPERSPSAGRGGEKAGGCLATGENLDTIGDPFYPGMGNAGYDALHYNINLSVDVSGNSISGTTTIQARAFQDLNAFDFDFLGLAISSLKENGQSAEYTRNGQELRITPNKPLKTGEEFSVEVTYSGVPEKSSEGGNTPATGWVKYPGGIYVASEPSGSATWYPVNDHPCDKASYTLRITVPKPYVVAANGLLKNTEDGASTTTYTWSTPNPVASYLVTINIGDFVRETSSSPAGVPIRSYFPPNMEAAAREPFRKMGDMIDYFSGIYGPYPFEAYGVVVADTELNFALETQTMSLFGNKVGSRVTSEEAVAHELAHQWFGDSVSLTRWRDIWLNEGFATFSQWSWIEHSRGKAAFSDIIRQSYSAVADRKPTPPGSPPPDDLFNMGVYIRGGLTLEALRVKIGDDAFFRTMRTYANRYKYGNASTADFIKTAEEESNSSLGAFFNAWLYATSLPEIPELGLKP